jgi:hypothetical protein
VDATNGTPDTRTRTMPSPTKTFYYYGTDLSKFVTFGKVNNRIQVTATSLPDDYPVGMLSPEKQLRACGFRPAKKVVQYDVWGGRIG